MSTCNVYKPEKKSPFSGRLYRVVENRTPDTHQIINYELQQYSNYAGKWYTLKTDVKPAPIVLEYEQNTGPL